MSKKIIVASQAYQVYCFFFFHCRVYLYVYLQQGDLIILDNSLSNNKITDFFNLKAFAVLSFRKQALVSKCLQYKYSENTVEKWSNCSKRAFLLFPQRFQPILGTFCHFHQISNCRQQTLLVWKHLKFVVWERVNTIHMMEPSLIA